MSTNAELIARLRDKYAFRWNAAMVIATCELAAAALETAEQNIEAQAVEIAELRKQINAALGGVVVLQELATQVVTAWKGGYTVAYVLPKLDAALQLTMRRPSNLRIIDAGRRAIVEARKDAARRERERCIEVCKHWINYYGKDGVSKALIEEKIRALPDEE